MSNGKDLNRAIGLAEKDREWEPSESSATNIRFTLNREVVWGLVNPLQD
jgi:hypothetical protein